MSSTGPTQGECTGTGLSEWPTPMTTIALAPGQVCQINSPFSREKLPLRTILSCSCQWLPPMFSTEDKVSSPQISPALFRAGPSETVSAARLHHNLLGHGAEQGVCFQHIPAPLLSLLLMWLFQRSNMPGPITFAGDANTDKTGVSALCSECIIGKHKSMPRLQSCVMTEVCSINTWGLAREGPVCLGELWGSLEGWIDKKRRKSSTCVFTHLSMGQALC